VSTVARSIKGTLIGSLNFAVHALQAVLAVPIMLNGWGASQYAIWLACQAGMTMVLTLESGHSLYVGNELAKSVPVDRDASRSIVGSAIRFSVILAVCEVAFVAIVWLSGSTHLLLGVTEQEARDQSLGAALFVLVASWLPVSAGGATLARLYPPTGKFVRATVWAMINKLVLITAAIIPAILHSSLLVTSISVGVSTLLLFGMLIVDARYNFPEFLPFTKLGSLMEGWVRFRASLSLTGTMLVSQLQTSGATLLVSSLFDTTTTASFATVRTLSNTAVQAAALVFAPAVPEFVRMHVRGEMEKVRVGLFGLTVVTSSASTIGALLLAAVAEPLYEVWTRHRIPFDAPLFHIIIAGTLWRIAGFPLSNHVLAMNDSRWIWLGSASQTVILFGLAAGGSPLFGISAVAVAILCSEVVGSFGVPVLWMYRALDEDQKHAFLTNQLATSAIPLVGTVTLLAAVAGHGSVRFLILASGVVACLVGAVVLLLRIPGSTRRDVLSAAMRIFSRSARNNQDDQRSKTNTRP
jgi:O-antigen/teichoic acid export membrane protein